MMSNNGLFVPVRQRRGYGVDEKVSFLAVEGRRPLQGSVRISGAKNAVLKLMAAALLTPEVCIIRNVPRIGDVLNMIEVLEGLGARCAMDEDVLMIEAGDLSPVAPHGPVRQMRASIQVMGPLLGRLGEVHISQPGGCAIGARPVDLHVAGFQALGAQIDEEQGMIYGRACRLVGGEIYFDTPSVGATENIMMAAAVADGDTVIRNAAREPEIVEVQNFINCMGGRIRGAGTDTIRIQGVKKLNKGVDYTVIPDRIEAGTWAVAAATTGGKLTISPVIIEHLESTASKLYEAGVRIDVVGETATISRPEGLKPLEIRSEAYPGFPTDMQPQLMAMLNWAHGTSVITETVHTNRFKHVEALRRMGADITIDGRMAVIRGPVPLSAARVEATDLRAGAALVIAALAAEGTTIIEGIHHIDRGYEDLVSKLNAVGARVEKMTPTEAAVS